MFKTDRAAAEAQLDNRTVTFKKCHGYVSPDKLRDRYTMQLAGTLFESTPATRRGSTG